MSFYRSQHVRQHPLAVNLDALPYDEALRQCDRLKRAFNRRFSAALSTHFPTHHSESLARVFWTDENSCLNTESVGKFLSPLNDRSAPWILRIYFNCSVGLFVPISIYYDLGAWIPYGPIVGREVRWQNETGWHFELSVLPQQLLDFPEWVAKWVSFRSLFRTDVESAEHFYGWTTEARAAMDAFQRLNARLKKIQPSDSDETCSINWILD